MRLADAPALPKRVALLVAALAGWLLGIGCGVDASGLGVASDAGRDTGADAPCSRLFRRAYMIKRCKDRDPE
jgi:hypothetical protein